MEKRPCVICDIDGTIAEMNERGPFHWDKVGQDKPIAVIINLLRLLAPVYEIVLVSGRSDESMKHTLKWLAEHDVPYTSVYMRKANDFRKDAIVKQELYEAHIEPYYDVQFVLEDRNQAVEMWRNLGLTCLQVAPGDF
jgi:2-hydroxy-3-keto-5-methylthiopentenyl-1-phosphate phosphatase